jgi:K+-dependent Na+/Ca+ exchanger-like protein
MSGCRCLLGAFVFASALVPDAAAASVFRQKNALVQDSGVNQSDVLSTWPHLSLLSFAEEKPANTDGYALLEDGNADKSGVFSTWPDLAIFSLGKQSPDADGYADTDSAHSRKGLPNDPAGDHHGGGPGAPNREASDTGIFPDHFSLLTAIFGPCEKATCATWGRSCTWGFVLSALLMAWTFKNLKVISDVYFVPATIKMARHLGMPADVAGATLLAFGSSAPEFCTNVVATFFIVNECGVGDIIGSAIHNILLVVGVSGFFATRALKLWWYPLSRDCFFYMVSVVELALFLWDEHITIPEASIMVLTYVVYCAWMMWNQPIYNRLCALLKASSAIPDEGDDDDDDDVDGVFYYDPIEVFWRVSMPSVDGKPYSCFFCSLCNIGWLSYLMVDAATRFGCVAGIPTLFMGLVFLAAGTSIPDAFASLGAAKRGEGDMAVSNALGSNIFDILLGLGLPWLIALMIGQPIVFLGAHRLLAWVTMLMAVIVVFMVIIVASNWTLNQRTGIVLLGFYVSYVGYALLKSFEVF